MIQKTKAIVLHSLHYGDSSLIVHVFTEEWGKVSLILKGARKSNRGSRSRLFQPFYLLDLDIDYREGRQLQYLRDAGFAAGVQVYTPDFTKSAQALFICEVLFRTIEEEERNPDLFRFLIRSSLSLFSREAHPSFHLVFLFRLSRYLGFYPTNNHSDKTPYFNPETGSFAPVPYRMEKEREQLLGMQWKTCFIEDYYSEDQVFNNHEKRNIFLDSMLGFYRIHHPSMRDIKSLEVLRSVFG